MKFVVVHRYVTLRLWDGQYHYYYASEQSPVKPTGGNRVGNWGKATSVLKQMQELILQLYVVMVPVFNQGTHGSSAHKAVITKALYV